MNFLLELWTVFASTVLGWFSAINNDVLETIANLLTILILIIALVEWRARKKAGKATKSQEKTQEKRQVLGLIENTQKPLKVVHMLDNPMEPGERLGNLVDSISKTIGGNKMKKFFKWLWYNKEQLLSIVYNVIIIAFANLAMFTDALAGIVGIGVMPLYAKIIVAVVSLAFTVLTVRNVVVKYGLSSLDTIDAHLAKKAEEAANKLTPEQKKALKSAISTLQTNVNKAITDKTSALKTLSEITALFNADSTLVPDYGAQKQALERDITKATATIDSLEVKIVEYKAQLSGKSVNK